MIISSRQFVCFIALLGSSLIIGSSKYLSRKLINDSKNSLQFSAENNISNNTPDCRIPTIDEFPSDFLTLEQKRHGGVLIHVLITIYLFCAVAIVCDEYFVQSLNRISKDLNLRDDVAGATFMAAGSSAPELFTSIIGVIIAKSDVGIGTIVGSAVFNVLFIIAICALATKAALTIDWYPLTRDCAYYIIAISALIAVIHDGVIHWYESVILIVLYAVYIFIMYFNEKIQRWVKTKFNSNVNYEFNEETLTLIDPDNLYSSPIKRPRSVSSNLFDEDDDEKPINPFEIPDNIYSKITFFLLFPINILFYLTVPDCRRKTFKRFPLYFLTFFISTTYLAVLTYILVWMVVIISYTLDIPDTIAGLTVLAAGTSVPEVVAGIIVTRKGKASMAISNSIGSNVFDILVCLGLPWFISTVLVDTNSIVKIYSGGIVYSTAILLGTVFVLVLGFSFNKWKLDKKFGAFMIICWVLTTVIMCLFELDVFGKYSIPLC